MVPMSRNPCRLCRSVVTFCLGRLLSILLHICCSEQVPKTKYIEFTKKLQAGPSEGETLEHHEATVEKMSYFSTIINCCLINWTSKEGPWTELWEFMLLLLIYTTQRQLPEVRL
jgi:hypothetical protein